MAKSMKHNFVLDQDPDNPFLNVDEDEDLKVKDPKMIPNPVKHP